MKILKFREVKGSFEPRIGDEKPMKNKPDVPKDVPKLDPEEMARSIKWSKTIWQVLDADAERCKRSAVRQLEAIVCTYYDLTEGVEMKAEHLENMQEAAEVLRQQPLARRKAS